LKKPINPRKFFSRLKRLDSSPLSILRYRQKIFSDVLHTFDAAGTLFLQPGTPAPGKKER